MMDVTVQVRRHVYLHRYAELLQLLILIPQLCTFFDQLVLHLFEFVQFWLHTPIVLQILLICFECLPQLSIFAALSIELLVNLTYILLQLQIAFRHG